METPRIPPRIDKIEDAFGCRDPQFIKERNAVLTSLILKRRDLLRLLLQRYAEGLTARPFGFAERINSARNEIRLLELRLQSEDWDLHISYLAREIATLPPKHRSALLDVIKPYLAEWSSIESNLEATRFTQTRLTQPENKNFRQICKKLNLSLTAATLQHLAEVNLHELAAARIPRSKKHSLSSKLAVRLPIEEHHDMSLVARQAGTTISKLLRALILDFTKLHQTP